MGNKQEKQQQQSSGSNLQLDKKTQEAYNSIFSFIAQNESVITGSLKDMFYKYDKDNSGTIDSPQEFANLWNDLFTLTVNHAKKERDLFPKMTDAEKTKFKDAFIKQIMTRFDKNGDGVISFKEFEQGMKYELKQIKSNPNW